MGSPSTPGVSTPGVSTSAPPASGASPGAAGDFSQALADELQRRLDEEGWQAGNPAPGRSAGESPPAGGEKAEHPLLRAGPDDLGIRFVNRDDGQGSPSRSAPRDQRYTFTPPLALRTSTPSTGQRYAEAPWPPPTTTPPPVPSGGARNPDTTMRPTVPPNEAPPGNSWTAILTTIAKRAGPFAAGVAGAAVTYFANTVPAGKERETGPTADGGHFTADERTIDVRRADGTQQRGFLNPDGNSWNTADGTPIARRNAAGEIEVLPPATKPTAPAGNDADRQQPVTMEEQRRSNREGVEIRSREEGDFVDSLSPDLTREQVQNKLDEFRQRNGAIGGGGGSKPPLETGKKDDPTPPERKPIPDAKRLTGPEQLTAGRFMAQRPDLKLTESKHEGAEYLDQFGRSYDQMGSKAGSDHWNKEGFLSAIDDHLLKSNDYTVIDLTDYTQEQRQIVSNYIDGLPQSSKDKIIKVGF